MKTHRQKKRKKYNYLLREFNKNLIVDAKRNGVCANCGGKDFLEFHHTDPSVKEGSVGKMWYDGKTKEEILNEISKCILLCHDCHVNLHRQKGNVIQEG